MRSLEGNGIAEAFGKEFKCDHVRLNVRPDAATVTTCLEAQFEDDNEVHPHRAPRMRSPRRFLRAQSQMTVVILDDLTVFICASTERIGCCDSIR